MELSWVALIWHDTTCGASKLSRWHHVFVQRHSFICDQCHHQNLTFASWMSNSRGRGSESLDFTPRSVRNLIELRLEIPSHLTEEFSRAAPEVPDFHGRLWSHGRDQIRMQQHRPFTEQTKRCRWKWRMTGRPLSYSISLFFFLSDWNFANDFCGKTHHSTIVPLVLEPDEKPNMERNWRYFAHCGSHEHIDRRM